MFIPSFVLNLQFKVAEAALNLLVKFGILCGKDRLSFSRVLQVERRKNKGGG